MPVSSSGALIALLLWLVFENPNKYLGGWLEQLGNKATTIADEYHEILDDYHEIKSSRRC